MSLKQYSRVRVITDRFSDEGVSNGMLGYIIEVHEDGAYEVEFSDSRGFTVAQVVANDADLQEAPEST